MKMDVREKAIQRWGFENARTIIICVLAEQGKVDLAEQFFDELTADED
jgi:pentatricopeptide repeat protein